MTLEEALAMTPKNPICAVDQGYAVLAAEVMRLQEKSESDTAEYKFSEGELKAAIGMSRRLYADQVNGLRVQAVEHSSLDNDEFIELISKAKVLQILRGE